MFSARPTWKTFDYCAARILLIHSALLTILVFRQSLTFDECGHLPAGISHWRHQDFTLYGVNPPFVRLVSSFPAAVFMPYELPAYSAHMEKRSEFYLGARIANEVPHFLIYWQIGRLLCVPFSIAGGLICYTWSRRLYGLSAGRAALCLWCFCPNILGNACLILPDAPAAALGVCTCYLFSKWLRCGTWSDSTWLGICLGATELTKFSWIILYFVLPTALIASSGINYALLGKLAKLFYSFLLSVWIINVGYCFEDTCLPLASNEYLCSQFSGFPIELNTKGNRWVGSTLGMILVPLPKNYLLGIDLIMYEFERGYWSYLSGELKAGGWWYYYFYGFAVKIPVGLHVLALVACGRVLHLISRRKYDLREVFSLCVALLFVGCASAQTGFSHHFRYVLPALPFVFIFCSSAFAVGSQSLLVQAFPRICLAGFILSSLACFPHSGSYFNEYVGGPLYGWRHMDGSNIGWGQDELFLRDWQRRRPNGEAVPLHVQTTGNIDPSLYGVKCKPVSAFVSGDTAYFPAGWYAISVHEMLRLNSNVLPFLSQKEVDRVAYSYFIYRLKRPMPVELDLRHEATVID